MQYQPTLTYDFPIDRGLRLRAVQGELAKVMTPPPSRTTLLKWLDEGLLEGKQLRFGWIVYESSLKEFVRGLQHDPIAA